MPAKVVGLTGGIGAGKTQASNYLQALGVTIVDADVIAREVVAAGQPALAHIAQTFGNTVISPDGALNRRALREIVFADPERRLQLEAITHPLIFSGIKRALAASQSAYSVLVSPLLLEGQQRNLVQRVLLVDCSTKQQLDRATLRDQQSTVAIQRIIDAQLPRAQRQQLADDIVLNDGSLAELQQKLDTLHQVYLAWALGG